MATQYALITVFASAISILHNHNWRNDDMRNQGDKKVGMCTVGWLVRSFEWFESEPATYLRLLDIDDFINSKYLGQECVLSWHRLWEW